VFVVRLRFFSREKSCQYSSVAQWQSIRLLTGGLLVRVQPEEPIASTTYNEPMLSGSFTVGEFVGTIRRNAVPTFLSAFVGLVAAGCDASVPAVQRSSPVDDVPMISILNEPRKFNAVRLRVRGICRIEFEGNALYLSRESHDERYGKQAIWLQLGWPVKPEIQQLDGRDVIVEGTYDAAATGHMGMFAGALKDIQGITASER
jgi:hypothetical protein